MQKKPRNVKQYYDFEFKGEKKASDRLWVRTTPAIDEEK